MSPAGPRPPAVLAPGAGAGVDGTGRGAATPSVSDPRSNPAFAPKKNASPRARITEITAASACPPVNDTW